MVQLRERWTDFALFPADMKGEGEEIADFSAYLLKEGRAGLPARQLFFKPRRPAYLAPAASASPARSAAPSAAPMARHASRSTIDQWVQWVPPCMYTAYGARSGPSAESSRVEPGQGSGSG